MADKNGVAVLELTANVEKKQFVNKENGETFDYYAVSVLVDGQKIPLSIPKESKALLKYLLNRYFE